jgi:hypothetical protein
MENTKGKTQVLQSGISTYSPPKMEYQTLKGTARADGDGVVQAVKGITDSQINGEASRGWRVIHAQMQGRKIVAVLMERVRVGK